MSTSHIRLEEVTLRYLSQQGELEALAGLSLDVAPGEFVGLVGPSGCGKSTILSLIAGLLFPSTGRVLVGGKRVTGPSRQIGYMLQRDHLFGWRTVMGNCLLGPEVHRLDLSEARTRVAYFLNQVGLGAFGEAYPDQLSGGMRQRAALVRTLATQPDILLLDEPFSALDYPTKLNLIDDVTAILKREAKTVVLVTHDIAEAISMCDRVVVLTGRPGRVRDQHHIDFGEAERPRPFLARQHPRFAPYFKRIWEELEGHVSR